ncbi:MAG: MauE/DoxX family redox-associated membrane protein [bacterium]
MRRIIDSDWLMVLSRVFIGFTFIFAAYYKITDPYTFAKSIWYYHLVPGEVINLMALILPWVELLCGLALILGLFYNGAVVLVNAMTVIFIVALGSTIVRGIDIDCGCFKASTASGDAAWRSLTFNLVLIVFALQLLFSRSRRWLLSSSLSKKQ